MTTPLGATGTTTGTTAGKATPVGGALGKDAFMQLLVAQMRYQNPMSPVDGQQYMAQLAQFAQVEKLESISKAQTDAAMWQKTVAGQEMLGRTVSGTGPSGSILTGTVTAVSITDAGPRLELSGGGSLSVDDVDAVTPQSPAAPATAR